MYIYILKILNIFLNFDIYNINSAILRFLILTSYSYSTI